MLEEGLDGSSDLGSGLGVGELGGNSELGLQRGQTHD